MTRLLFSCRSAAVLSLAEWLKGLWEQSREWIHQLQQVDCCLLVFTEYNRNTAFLLRTPSRSGSPLLIKRIQSQMHGYSKKVLIAVEVEPVLGGLHLQPWFRMTAELLWLEQDSSSVKIQAATPALTVSCAGESLSSFLHCKILLKIP